MQKSMIILQDVFLNQVRKEKVVVTIHLTNGYQIKGVIKGFDNFIIILESEGKQLMIYKHAVSTVSPSKTVLFPFTDKPAVKPAEKPEEKPDDLEPKRRFVKED
ncbi:MAG: RNA chaperone Hfq [Clostridia bacterium]|nr:RNA chaperone Hfq [Clostridia bacterium]MBT7123004.1 RNA chaperone Hfq [Clostridia bacterium]